MSADQQSITAGEYIIHHLTQWTSGPRAGVIDFGIVDIDSIIVSVALGLLACFLLWRVAKRMTSGTPGRMQAAVEFLVEFVDEQARGIVRNAKSREFVAPLAFISFVWIVMMNAMDLLPVDLLPRLWQGAGAMAGHNPEHMYLRVVPTADLSIALGMSITILLLSLYYGMRIKGVGGWIHELFTAPFGNHVLLWPLNFAMQLLEYLAKTLSHGMRLFGNLYAEEILFMIIALMGAAGLSSLTGWTLFFGNIVAGFAWSVFSLLIIVLQGFIFMMLTLVYIGQAHDHH
ncbi:MAG: F0F1 ATP synthase subunit A [Betaproteobacteria bacterium]|nr:F0F1 ATP synthase subunit A [Betaproteobacteria bacterium]MDE2122696.1 F0F1 ATP synthase subunit A [Betaproteobacteria bacterium]MDE2186753.1 F0F1 ATP synthase subunit A [Betaproteobacteria bacterium]MDE2323717.1 F0F1 ATP synthase subunit A [Betaproteobacteria bacterium]